MLNYHYTFVPNETDDLHCLQSTIRMVWEGLFGEPLTLTDAEKLTNFRAGQQTWPFAAMLAMADAGATVTNVEDFDPRLFIRDPAAELRRQCNQNEELVLHILQVSDADAEVQIVKRCLEHPRVEFDARPPSLTDLIEAVSNQGTAVICNVNYRALVNQSGYNGHFVLVESADQRTVRLQDPGLPPLEAHEVEAATFLNAWTLPDPKLANMIVCSTTPVPEYVSHQTTAKP
jgi:hypothetical protein